MVEKDAAAGIHLVRLAIIDRNPVCVEFGGRIG